MRAHCAHCAQTLQDDLSSSARVSEHQPLTSPSCSHPVASQIALLLPPCSLATAYATCTPTLFAARGPFVHPGAVILHMPGQLSPFPLPPHHAAPWARPLAAQALRPQPRPRPRPRPRPQLLPCPRLRPGPCRRAQRPAVGHLHWCANARVGAVGSLPHELPEGRAQALHYR